jgi:hypothetical protein
MHPQHAVARSQSGFPVGLEPEDLVDPQQRRLRSVMGRPCSRDPAIPACTRARRSPTSRIEWLPDAEPEKTAPVVRTESAAERGPHEVGYVPE